MQRTLIIILAILTTSVLYSQKVTTFAIKLNGGMVVKPTTLPNNAAIEVEAKITTKRKLNTYHITITEPNPTKDWHRVYICNDATGNELKRITLKSTNAPCTFALPSTVTNFTLITMTQPNDPAAAATMRLRSFPLAHIQLINK